MRIRALVLPPGFSARSPFRGATLGSSSQNSIRSSSVIVEGCSFRGSPGSGIITLKQSRKAVAVLFGISASVRTTAISSTFRIASGLPQYSIIVFSMLDLARVTVTRHTPFLISGARQSTDTADSPISGELGILIIRPWFADVSRSFFSRVGRNSRLNAYVNDTRRSESRSALPLATLCSLRPIATSKAMRAPT